MAAAFQQYVFGAAFQQYVSAVAFQQYVGSAAFQQYVSPVPSVLYQVRAATHVGISIEPHHSDQPQWTNPRTDIVWHGDAHATNDITTMLVAADVYAVNTARTMLCYTNLDGSDA